MKNCTYTAGSITRAYRLRAELSELGIKSEIVKLDPSKSKNGCAYGLTLDCASSRAALRVLGQNTEQIE